MNLPPYPLTLVGESGSDPIYALDADLPPLGMNFMMAYDTRHKVFLLVTGGPEEAPTVWALKLNRPR